MHWLETKEWARPGGIPFFICIYSFRSYLCDKCYFYRYSENWKKEKQKHFKIWNRPHVRWGKFSIDENIIIGRQKIIIEIRMWFHSTNWWLLNLKRENSKHKITSSELIEPKCSFAVPSNERNKSCVLYVQYCILYAKHQKSKKKRIKNKLKQVFKSHNLINNELMYGVQSTVLTERL